MDIIVRISQELKLRENSVRAAVRLMDEGSTVPFIARYRKEATGNLTDADLRSVEERLIYLRNLEERMVTVLQTITEIGKLTPELEREINSVKTITELEDIYRPYKPKKRTRASIAKEKGLEPLAQYIIAGKRGSDFNAYMSSFLDPKKELNTLADLLKGVSDIVAEDIADKAEYRKFIKDLILKEGFICSKELAKDEKDTYHLYADYKERIATIPPHRILAINRGEREKCLKVTLEYSLETVQEKISADYTKNNDFASFLEASVSDALHRLIVPSVENEIRNELSERAEDSSIITFKKNLKSLLLVPPLKDKVILGFDPGFRTGCKYALVNRNGIPVEVGVFNITAASEGEKQRARVAILNLLKNYQIDYIALGNGTASRESEAELSKIIKDNNLSVKIFIVNESGASVYSASALGEQEFPELSVEKRSAISLARRLQDPLNELVKIDPKSVGVGQYQHDMNQRKLGDALNGVVEDVVNLVGVNLNNATPSILKYISGINKTLADNIYLYLKEHGRFRNREELKNVAKLGSKAFEQCAGFLRIYGGDEPLDTTSIHPESYAVARLILKRCSIDILNDSLEVKEEKLARLDVSSFIRESGIGKETLKDIIDEIKQPGRDIRDEVETVELNNNVRDISDLRVGMVLNGTVRNIMDFGMFVDINVHQDGLVHISEVAKKFVKNIGDLYSINDVVKVKVISVDVAKKRIGLSIKQVD